MPNFAYEAVDSTGKAQKGSISAASEQEVREKRRGKGFHPTAITAARGGGRPTARPPPPSTPASAR